MSLSNFLAIKEIRQEFSQYVNKPKLILDNEILANPLSKNYSLVGVAFDYIFRFYLKYINSESKTSTWVAEISILNINDKLFKRKDEAVIILDKTKQLYLQYLKDGNMTNELIRLVLIISKFDIYYRCGVIEDDFEIIDKNDVVDIFNQYNILQNNDWKMKICCSLNPTFGIASSLVGGADADFIIDDLLIDIKSTKKLELNIDDFNQLVGYYLLSCLYKISGCPDNHKIKRIGFYYSRYGLLIEFKVKDIINKDTFKEFKKWFVKEAMIRNNIPSIAITGWRKMGFKG